MRIARVPNELFWPVFVYSWPVWLCSPDRHVVPEKKELTVQDHIGVFNGIKSEPTFYYLKDKGE
jgi:hypothetical protein